jgi:hypothetical protein
MLIPHPSGSYQFLQGIDPYSCGVVAEAGYEIVHATLARHLPWREGCDWVTSYLQRLGLERSALCAMELRSPAPFSLQGFIDFNNEYCALLKSWDLYVGDLNPLARTNVVPAHHPPEVPSLHAFSYVIPHRDIQRPTLIVAGAGELREGVLDSAGIIRPGDTSPAAIHEKAAHVMQVMCDRLQALGGEWNLINDVDIYTVHPLDEILGQVILPAIGPARARGTRWIYSRPPVIDIEFEMDLHGVVTDKVV